ncbi:MAG: hypothetical protein IPO15_23485, partial [Anaerolineae bacterium]|nr:hypothetical protein [Anaerolineae bacterium]
MNDTTINACINCDRDENQVPVAALAHGRPHVPYLPRLPADAHPSPRR